MLVITQARRLVNRRERMSKIYIPMGGKIVVCPDAGCCGCEHGEPHEFDTVDSSCTEGGDNNCPPCEGAKA